MSSSKIQKLDNQQTNNQKVTNSEKNTQKRKVKTTKLENEVVNDINLEISSSNAIAESILHLERELSEKLSQIKFRAPVDYVYNPIEYAYDVHANFVKTYCQGRKKILYLGINPGPWGMSQNGVPFGEVSMVKDWLKLSGKIEKPPREHPERIISGFDCTRKEVSGLRFWGFFRELCKTTDVFFRHSYVHNYCPLAFMNSNAKNITPADLKADEKRELLAICDEVLRKIIKLLNVEIVIGVGRFAEERVKEILRDETNVNVIYMPHPSPRAVNNENWPEKAKMTLERNKLLEYYSQ